MFGKINIQFKTMRCVVIILPYTGSTKVNSLDLHNRRKLTIKWELSLLHVVCYNANIDDRHYTKLYEKQHYK